MYIYKNNEKMKKMLFVLILFAVGLSGFGQNVSSKKLVDGVTIFSDTNIWVSTTAFNNNYAWQLWFSYDSSNITLTPSVQVLVSVDSVAWLPYAQMDSITLVDSLGSKAFEDGMLLSNYMRLHFNLGTGDTIRRLSVWYTMKRP